MDNCFDPENINKILKIYSYFVINKGESILCIKKYFSEPFYNKETEIQKDDYILQINENFVMDKQELQDQVKNKKKHRLPNFKKWRFYDYKDYTE